jgi:energy-coupling factor transporter ATP-binding protein EcfA2
LISVEDFSYQYSASDEPALRDIYLHIEAGSFVALLGANDAGKSTLCYALSGFVPHFFGGQATGRITINDHDLRQEQPADLAGDIGLVFQDPFNQISGARFTVREEVAFGLENLGVARAEMDARIDRVLEQTGLLELAMRSPYALSGGQQQRLALASVMVMQPRVLILDEPTSQLDPAGTLEVFASLKQMAQAGDTTIILAEHKLEWIASFAERAMLLQAGQIVDDGQPTAVITGERARAADLGATRFTRAAELSKEHGLVNRDRPLPVDLQAAVKFFR